MKTAKEQRIAMSKDEMLRALWLLDDYIESFGWHFVSKDGFPDEKEHNKHGYWCKMANGEYKILYYENGFFEYKGTLRMHIPNNNAVVAWQRLTEI